MPVTCRSSDNSAPEIVQEAIRQHLKEPHLDTHMSCLLEDLGGHPCRGLHCAYAGPSGKKLKVSGLHKMRLNNPKPLMDPRPPTVKRKARKNKPLKAKSRRK